MTRDWAWRRPGQEKTLFRARGCLERLLSGADIKTINSFIIFHSSTQECETVLNILHLIQKYRLFHGFSFVIVKSQYCILKSKLDPQGRLFQGGRAANFIKCKFSLRFLFGFVVRMLQMQTCSKNTFERSAMPLQFSRQSRKQWLLSVVSFAESGPRDHG